MHLSVWYVYHHTDSIGGRVFSSHGCAYCPGRLMVTLFHRNYVVYLGSDVRVRIFSCTLYLFVLVYICIHIININVSGGIRPG